MMVQSFEDELALRQQDFDEFVAKYLKIQEAEAIQAAQKAAPKSSLARFLASTQRAVSSSRAA